MMSKQRVARALLSTTLHGKLGADWSSTAAKVCWSFLHQQPRWLSSKTPKSSGLPSPAIHSDRVEVADSIQFPSKEVIKIESQESEVASQQRKRRGKKEIIRMDPKEYAQAELDLPLPSFLERRGEMSTIRHFVPGKKKETVNLLCFIQQDLDLRPSNLRRIWKSIDVEYELKMQTYNHDRQSVLGSDLSVAHFLVARKGKVRFQNHTEWISSYRTDVETEKDERDLPAMKPDLCTMPVRYDPHYRVEAIDASGITIYYEGLENFANLNHVKWMSLRESPMLNDWGLDRVNGLLCETLEYLDLSGCSRISDRGLASLWRMSNLKTLVVKGMEHVDKLEIVCAHLEDRLPGLTCIGVDYEGKAKELAERTVLLEKESEERKGMEEPVIPEPRMDVMGDVPRYF